MQTPGAAKREAKDISLTGHYAQVVVWQADKCQALSGYRTADAHFAKAGFIDRVCSASGLQVVGRLREDARLRYLYTGPATGKPGRPRQYAGRVELSRPNFDHFTMSHQDRQVRIYSAVVNCPFLRRNIKLAYTQFLDADTGLPTHHKLYFSTDLDLPAWMITKHYCLRYQRSAARQEFLIRKAKQFTGLADCHARSVDKADYHINAALTAVNLAKVEQDVKADEPFSMADVKALHHNESLLDRFISILPKGVEVDKNHPEVRQLY